MVQPPGVHGLLDPLAQVQHPVQHLARQGGQLQRTCYLRHGRGDLGAPRGARHGHHPPLLVHHHGGTHAGDRPLAWGNLCWVVVGGREGWTHHVVFRWVHSVRVDQSRIGEVVHLE